MTIAFYLDVHVPRAVAVALRSRGIDVLTAQEDGSAELSDPELLRRATTLDRVLFSQDEDLLREARYCLESGLGFAGVVYGHQLDVTIGQAVRDLDLIARCCSREELTSAVLYLPL